MKYCVEEGGIFLKKQTNIRILKSKINNILKGDLVKVLGLTAFSNFLKIIINLISTKVVAVFCKFLGKWKDLKYYRIVK